MDIIGKIADIGKELGLKFGPGHLQDICLIVDYWQRTIATTITFFSSNIGREKLRRTVQSGGA